MAGRTWTTTKAERKDVPLMIGLMGQTGGGKTLSALRLATGIQRVVGGRISFIDTEANRGLHYATEFDYDHQPFEAPFSSLDYLGAVTHAHEKKGATVVIIDSMSHEHDGVGGLLEAHDAERARLAKQFKVGEYAMDFSAWEAPKSARRKMLNGFLQLPIVTILCFRSKNKRKPGTDDKGKKVIEDLGTLPIAGEEIVFEMTVNGLLMNGSNGIPRWEGFTDRERLLFKLPAQFKTLFGPQSQFCEEHGEAMARWAKGGGATFYGVERAIKTARTKAELDTPSKAAGAALKSGEINRAEFEGLKWLFVRRARELERAPEREETDLGPVDEPPPPAAAAPPPEAA